MGWYDAGNPPIVSSATAQPVSNPSTLTLLNEIDSTQLGTAFYPTNHSQLFRATLFIGGDTNLTVQFEAAKSTALSGSTQIYYIKTPTAQSGQYVMNFRLKKDYRLRCRCASTATTSVVCSIQAEVLT